MRIIAGELKGRKIIFPEKKNTRPLRDLVKESIFNIIENSNKFEIQIKGSKILDLFSGSGSFGLECISRGADKVIFFENYSCTLKILEKNVEDEKGNVTRFLIMGKNVHQPNYVKDKKFITSCIFRLKSIPSALYKCLGGFATNQINMTKLESFSVKNTFDQANFYLDFEGHLEEKRVQIAMEELGFHTQSLDVLGVYEASKFRKK